MAGVNVINAGGVKQALTEIRARDAGNVDRVIQEGRIIGPDGVDRTFYSQFAVSVDPTKAVAKFNSATSTTMTTRAVTASVTGAIGAVTFLWSQVSGDPMTIDSPNSASTTFSAAAAPGAIVSGNFKCTVSDAGGHSADTPNVIGTVVNLYGGTL